MSPDAVMIWTGLAVALFVVTALYAASQKSYQAVLLAAGLACAFVPTFWTALQAT